MENFPQPDSIWIKLLTAKYLMNNQEVVQIFKTDIGLIAWKNTLDHRYLPKKETSGS